MLVGGGPPIELSPNPIGADPPIARGGGAISAERGSASMLAAKDAAEGIARGGGAIKAAKGSYDAEEDSVAQKTKLSTK